MTSAALFICLGRIILGLFFLIAGIRNTLAFTERAKLDTNYGWKLPPTLTALGFAMQIIGGVSLVFGLYPVCGAIFLILFLIAATALFHNFLLFQGEARQPHLYFTLVNTALVGHCLMVIGTLL